ncbi:histone deacetylation protein Rxt3-domain-containing protein [Fennellomyces sp. T-0311]|nr:histone deacetylation protein Rxt3-domain-containing protein [Fennellomyces sp. T-0311]
MLLKRVYWLQGSYLYSPGLLLPINESQLNSLVEVVIPARYLTYDNPQIKRKAVWGTDIYTDDSDIVPMIVHSGKYSMAFVEPDIDPRDPFFVALGAEMDDEDKSKRPSKYEIPDHDLKVTLRVMPTLKRYTGTIRHYIASRTWGGDHDGASYWVECVEKIDRGEAQPKGRQGIKANMMKYAYERYLTVGPPASVKRRYMREDAEEEPSLVSVVRRSKSKTKKKVKVVSPPPAPSASRRRVRRAAAKV